MSEEHSSAVLGSWLSLPAVPLPSEGSLAREFRRRGCADLRDAAQLVCALPYGRNSDRAEYRLVLRELRGTCSTKHALIAALAEEIGLELDLIVGVYEMNGSNTPGVSPVLSAAGLDAIPEAHTYLKLGEQRIDLTRQHASALASDALLHEERITLSAIGAYKVKLHKSYLGKWLEFHPEIRMSLEELWSVRERCIATLATPEPSTAGR